MLTACSPGAETPSPESLGLRLRQMGLCPGPWMGLGPGSLQCWWGCGGEGSVVLSAGDHGPTEQRSGPSRSRAGHGGPVSPGQCSRRTCPARGAKVSPQLYSVRASGAGGFPELAWFPPSSCVVSGRLCG